MASEKTSVNGEWNTIIENSRQDQSEKIKFCKINDQSEKIKFCNLKLYLLNGV